MKGGPLFGSQPGFLPMGRGERHSLCHRQWMPTHPPRVRGQGQLRAGQGLTVQGKGRAWAWHPLCGLGGRYGKARHEGETLRHYSSPCPFPMLCHVPITGATMGLANKATIKCIQALNNYGKGSTGDILSALETVLEVSVITSMIKQRRSNRKDKGALALSLFTLHVVE